MRTTILVGLVALLVSSACSDETGILLKATTAEDFAGSIDHIRFYVGEDVVAGDRSFADSDPAPDVAVYGSLADKPYKLLVRPKKGGEDARIAVGVLAYDESGETIGAAYIQEPIGFVKGSVTEWELMIVPLGSDVSDSNDCFKWLVDGQWNYIGREGDLDCDGDPSLTDCDDQDSQVAHNRRERCGNGIDDNCVNGVDEDEDLDGDSFSTCDPDPQMRDCDDGSAYVNPGEREECNGFDDNCDGFCDEGFDSDVDLVTTCGSLLNDSGSRCEEGPVCVPGAQEYCDGVDGDCLNGEISESPCFVGGAANCRQGVRVCQDGGLEPGCSLNGGDATNPLPPEFCSAYANCEALAVQDPYECVVDLLDTVPASEENCVLSTQAGNSCGRGAVQIVVPAMFGGIDCSYTLIGGTDQQGFKVGLSAEATGSQSTVVNSCDAYLFVEAHGGATDAVVTILFDDGAGVKKAMKVLLSTTIVTSCDGMTLLSCESWQPAQML